MTGTQTAVSAVRRPLLWYCTTAASLAVALIPIWILETRFGVPRKIIVGYGFLALIIGALVKLVVHSTIVDRRLSAQLPIGPLAVTHGLLSAVTELGAAAAFFICVIPRLSFWQLVGFGVGAGAVEAIMLPFIANPFKGTKLGEHAEDVYRRSASTRAIQWLGVVERIWAMLLQISTRGLVYLGLAGHNPLPVIVAIAGFGTVDGVAYLWHLKKVRFDSLAVLARVHVFAALAAALLTGTFLLAARSFSFPR